MKKIKLKSLTKTIYLDSIAVNREGVDLFLKSQSWPLTEKKFKELYNLLYLEYYKKLQKLEIEEYYVGIIEVGFLNHLIQILHYNYVKNFAIKNDIKIHSSSLTKNLLLPNWKKLANFYNNYSYPYNKIERVLRRFIKLVYFNRHLSCFKILLGLFKPKTNLSLGSFDKVKRDYIIKSNLFYNHMEWVDLINNGLKKKIEKKILDAKVNEVILKVIKPILIKIFKNKKLKEFSSGLSYDVILNAWASRIKNLFILQLGLRGLRNIDKILISEAGNPYHKLIASTVKKSALVVNFSHGNELCFIDKKWTHNYLFSMSDQYIFENKGIEKSFKKYFLKNNFFHKKEKINFSSLDVKYKTYQNKTSLIKRTKNRIVLMGYPMNVKRYTDEAYLFFHYKLRLELHLLKELKKTSYEIYYKAHPDRFLELGDIYKDQKIQIIKERFENVWHTADALIFTYTSSSTFGFALNCDVPIILIEASGTPWIKGRRSLLEKRISILSNYNDENYEKISYKKLFLAIEDAREKAKINLAL